MAKAKITSVNPIDLALAETSDRDLPNRLIAQQIELVDAQLTEIRIKRILWGGVAAMMAFEAASGLDMLGPDIRLYRQMMALIRSTA